MGFHQDKLKKFKLDLSWRSQRSDEEVEIIAEGITSQLPSLEELTLCFNQTAISDQGLLAIENHIVEKSLNLTKLILEFHENNYFQTKNITSLITKIINNLPRLTELYLDFPALNTHPYNRNSYRSEIEEILSKRNIPTLKLGNK